MTLDQRVPLERAPFVQGRVLDRAVHYDPRSAEYRAQDATAIRDTPRSKTWRCEVVLDQGAEGACVGFGWSAELAAEPVIVPAITDDSARQLYHRARQLDEQPGEAYEGTSVLAGAKAVAEAGHLDEYRWAFGLDELRLAVSWLGPAVLGIPWYGSMYQPQRTSVNGWPMLQLAGGVVGGHCILVRGYNHTTRRWTLHNSWGRSWGRNGIAFATDETMAELVFAGQGEACIPVRRK